MASLNADLHAHSSVSDGTLSPHDLVRRAKARRVELFALTDHDELEGLPAARATAASIGLAFVPGVEVSITYAGITVHVVGLGIDADAEVLVQGLARLRAGRLERAHEMAAGLVGAGIENAFEGALRYVGNPDLISRTHFARFLVECGVCSCTQEVFGRYLVEGKPGYVEHRWAELTEAVGWIRAAGGVPVLAHPGRYRLSEEELHTLLGRFKEAGGIALEVVTSNHSSAQTRRFALLAREFGFEGSRGSDFHAPGESRVELGRIAVLPADVVPVWHRFL